VRMYSAGQVYQFRRPGDFRWEAGEALIHMLQVPRHLLDAPYRAVPGKSATRGSRANDGVRPTAEVADSEVRIILIEIRRLFKERS
jgi:hypothetical protein